MKSALFVIFFTCQLLIGQNSDTYKLLWKIEGNGVTAPSYLFGTMHVEDARAFNFSDAVMPAIKSCEKFALEVNADSIVIAINNKIILKDPKDEFKSVLNEDEYKRLLDRFIEVNGYSFEDSELKDINTILGLLYKEPEKTDDKATFVDLHLFGQAKTMGKTIIGLESIESQINTYENLRLEDKRSYIMDNLDYTKNDADKILEQLTKIYYTGDIVEIERIVDEYGEFENEVMISRNKVMCSSIDKTIQKTTLFSAVGAAHLPGKHGVINLLKERGYTVTPVKAEFTGVAETYKVDLSKGKWYTFKDDQLGYSVELPQAPNNNEEFDGFTIYTYSSMVDESSYMIFGMDFRHVEGDINFRKLADNYVKNITKSDKGEVVNDKEYKDGSVEYIDNTIKMADSSFLKSKLIFKDKLLYFISNQTKIDASETNGSKRFFNSIKFSTPQKEIQKVNNDTAWKTVINSNGAFSIDLPGTPKDISRETPNPAEPEGENYFLNMYNIIDMKNKNNYLYRYNDVPSGYFMENPEDGFAAMEVNMTANGSLLSEPKIISLDGYEGREYEISLQEKYHTICRVYFRGNRTYLILQQKLNEIDKVNPDNAYFNNFKFIDYEPKSLITRNIKNTSIEIKEFENNKVEIDTLDFDTSYLKNTYTYYSTNPSSGDVYQFSYGDLQDYFRIDNLNEFYDLNLGYLKNWKDTIISRKAIKINNTDGVEALIKNETTNVESLHRVWVEDKKLLLYTAYTSNNAYSNSMTDTIFNSYKITPNSKEFDIYSSKTNLIFKDLKTKDSLVKSRALGAFDYYVFEEKDLELLHKNLTTSYENDSITQDIRLKIIREFKDLNNAETLGNLEHLYKNSSSSDLLKSEILSTIQNLNTTEALTSFLNLLFTDTPEDLSNNQWTIMSPFRDSLALTLSNYDKLIDFIDREDFRQSILSLSNDVLEEKKDSLNIVSNHFDSLLKHSKDDLKNYLLTQKDTSNYDYTYNGRIYQYLKLMEQPTVNTNMVNKFTNQIITREDNTWFQQHAASARIIHELPIEKELLKSLLDSTTSRFKIMKAFHNVGDLKKVPKKYLTNESFAKLSLLNYLEDDDYYDYDIEVLDSYQQDGKNYLGFKIIYSYDDNDENYFTLVGPIYDLSKAKDLKLYDVKLDWTEYDDDWKSLAKTLLLETKAKE